jgi:hypothetical protein
MPTVQVEANLSSAQLLQAVKQLAPAELDQFTHQVLALRAHRQAPHVSAAEAQLLLKINEGLPDPLRQRYDTLIQKRTAGVLTAEELAELVQLGDQVEQREADRLQALVQLAHLRQISLDQLMQDLGLANRSHG